MNPDRKLLNATAEALTATLGFESPADAVLSSYFRQRHALGQHDRGFIADAVFGVLRHKRTLDHLAGDATPRRLVLAWAVRFGGIGARQLAGVIPPDDGKWLSELKAAEIDRLPPAVRAELPDWAFERLGAELGAEEALVVGRSLQQPAPLDLRVNTLCCDRDSACRALAESGIDATATPYSPLGLRLKGKPAINRDPLFLNGGVEVQDEGSQLVGLLVAPRRRELVVDFCAGAGGKSLLLGATMSSQGRLYAFDVSPTRLARLRQRLKRSGLSNIHPHLLANEHDVKVKRLAGKIDRVLVDAPCSGFGTLRRNPDLKWRQSPRSVAEMRAKQASILEAAATLVKPGGRLVYATCSLLREENEEIVDAFMAGHPEFASLHCGDILRQGGVGIEMGERLRLWPHVHGTDAFFGAVLEHAKGTSKTP